MQVSKPIWLKVRKWEVGAHKYSTHGRSVVLEAGKCRDNVLYGCITTRPLPPWNTLALLMWQYRFPGQSIERFAEEWWWGSEVSRGQAQCQSKTLSYYISHTTLSDKRRATIVFESDIQGPCIHFSRCFFFLLGGRGLGVKWLPDH